MTSPHKRVPASTRFRLNRKIIDRPFVAPMFLKSRSSMRPLMVSGSTEVVIDGFPRSANSYAYYAFRQANPGVQLAGHTHSAHTIRAAVRRGLPVFLLVREPGPTAASLMQFVPGLDVRVALNAYLTFHRAALRQVDGVLVAPFDRVIHDLGDVIRAGNRRWGTEFVEYRREALDEGAVLDALDSANARYYGGHEATAPRPSELRRSPEAVIGNLDSRSAAKMAEAEALYAQLRQRAPAP